MNPDETFTRRLTAGAESVEAMLDALLAPGTLDGEITRPARLVDAMRHGALGGGKRLRPFLAMETAEMLGFPREKALRAACAIELVHCYSLVHDDLPAMDDDDLRRGRPTVHKAFDEATAILAGDGLLTLAFDVMAAVETHPDPSVRADLVLGLARASGLGGMVGGQMLDLAAESSVQPLTPAQVGQLQAMKTGAILKFSADCGAILAGASQEERRRISAYGTALGAAFQIADDILDAEGDAKLLGKKAGKDADRNKATLVSALGIEGARKACDEQVAAAGAALAPFGERAEILIHAARFTASRSH